MRSVLSTESTFEFRLPDIGEGVTEGEIVEWHVKPGDAVQEDAPMVDVMTDKATVTIGAPRDGVVRELRFAVGETATVGAVLVVFGAESHSRASSPAADVRTESQVAKAERASAPPAATAVGDIRDALPGASYFATGTPSASAETTPATPEKPPPFVSEQPLATPATRKLARDLGVDLRHVRPSDPSGRITREDVRAAARGGAPQDAALGVATTLARGSRSSAELPAEQRRPFVGLRRRIAERMQAAKNTAAHYTFVEECHCDRLVTLRSRLRAKAEERGAKLSYLPFIVKATVAALKRHPTLNATLDETRNELVYLQRYHIGIAAATEAGLVVPVVRDADQKTILELAQEIERLAEGARNGTLSAAELSGSTFTITSLGRQGGLLATPVLNLPEVGILGVHRLKQTPVVRDGEIVVGNVMLLSLSMDHRIVDGHVGAAFAYDVIECLENPDQLLLDLA